MCSYLSLTRVELRGLKDFLPNMKGFGVISGLQFLLICRLGEYDKTYAVLTTIIVRQITSNLRIRPNVCNMYKPANIRVMAWFAAWLVRVSVL